MASDEKRLTIEELEAETGALLPDKEVLSVPLLDLNVDIDLMLALAAPIDLAVAGNLNVALPADAGVAANVLAVSSTATSVADQGVVLDQLIRGEAIAESTQTAAIQQLDANDTPAPAPTGETSAPALTPGAAAIPAYTLTEPAAGAPSPRVRRHNPQQRPPSLLRRRRRRRRPLRRRPRRRRRHRRPHQPGPPRPRAPSRPWPPRSPRRRRPHRPSRPPSR